MLRNMYMKIKIIIYFFNIITVNTYACVVTFINDTDSRIMILNKQDRTLTPIMKNEKRRFGNAHTYTSFDIYIHEPRKKNMVKAYSCEQQSCNNDGVLMLKFSDIKNKTQATRFFTITLYESPTSMVERVTKKMQ